MIKAAHMILYTKDAEADRAFFRDVLKFPSVDAGGGWLIFALPPSEMAMHPAEHGGSQELYFMVEDLEAASKALASKGVVCSQSSDEGWGILMHITLPSGAQIGLYQPRHASPVMG